MGDEPKLRERRMAAPPTQLLDLALSTAREAGALLCEMFTAELSPTATKSSPTDLVSEADLKSEQLIRDRLLSARPDDSILGEEGDDVKGTTGLRWVVDPLDGTVDYLFGIPQWCVSIACEDEKGNTLLGVVFDPIHDEMWSAQVGDPALLNGERIKRHNRPLTLATALVATGFGYEAKVRAVQAEIIANLLPDIRDIRRAGSAALDLAWAAGGRVDAYFELGVKHWDLAAGELICRCSGLKTVSLPPRPPADGGLLVARPEIFEELYERLTNTR